MTNVTLPFYNGARPADDVGHGWNDILVRLHGQLLETDPDYELVQLKEKFGGLRFYTGPLSGEGHQFVSEAERESYKVCEVCGKSGSPDKDRGWIKTLCDEHKAAR